MDITITEKRAVEVLDYTGDYIIGTDTFGKTDKFCASCGQLNVWVDLADGDYYVGKTFVCLSCDTIFHLVDGQMDFNVLKDLKSTESVDTYDKLTNA